MNEIDYQEDKDDKCYDTCAWHDNPDNPGNQLTPRKITDCTDGCKWDKDDITLTKDGSCHRFSSRSSKEILDKIEQTTYFNCDPVTAICRYADSQGAPQQFSCLQHLNGPERTQYKVSRQAVCHCL